MKVQFAKTSFVPAIKVKGLSRHERKARNRQTANGHIIGLGGGIPVVDYVAPSAWYNGRKVS